MKMNKLIKKFSSALESATSPEYKSFIYKQAHIAKMLKLNSEEDFEHFHYISQLAPRVTRAIFSSNNSVFSAAISKLAMDNLRGSTSGLEKTEDAIEKAVLKLAYPNTVVSDGEKLKDYDINKWSKALNDIHMRARVYGNKREAINFVTQGWSDMDEKLDFERWMKYYEKDFGLYRGASENNSLVSNAFSGLPLQAITGITDKMSPERVYKPEEGPIMDGSVKQKKPSTVDDIKKKIMGRITSAKKLLATPEGRELAGPRLEKLWTLLQQFEGEVVTIKTAAVLDVIIKRAINIAQASDELNEDSKELLIRVAQLPPLPDLGSPMEEAPPPPGGGQAAAGDPNEGLKAIEEFVLGVKGYSNKDNTPKAIHEKFNDIKSEYEKKTGNNLDEVKAASWVDIETPELKKLAKVAGLIGDVAKQAKKSIVAIAQIAPPAPVAPPDMPPQANPAAAAPTAPVAIPAPNQADISELDSDEEKEYEESPKKKKAIDPTEIRDALKENSLEKQTADLAAMDEIDKAFANVKLSDVINRLQALSRVFKNREIARQLGIIDIMLDKLGISGFFPSLAEATRSALESNQYCQSRIEEILSKLISATNENGESILNNNLTGYDNIIDKKMKEYTADGNSKEEGKMSAEVPTPNKNVIKPEQPIPAPQEETAMPTETV